jgi:hypothetical protein
MHWEIFLGKCFWARVEHSVNDSDGKKKAESDVYSRIVELEALITP